jgi:hypothetical protein
LELQKKSDWDVQEVLSSESSEISGETGRSKKDSLVNKMKARFYQSAKIGEILGRPDRNRISHHLFAETPE